MAAVSGPSIANHPSPFREAALLTLLSCQEWSWTALTAKNAPKCLPVVTDTQIASLTLHHPPSSRTSIIQWLQSQIFSVPI
jgi:hypothetical protein